MLINSGVYFGFAISISILLAVSIGWVAYKKLGKYGVLMGILVSAFAWGAAQTAAGHTYIVDSDDNVLDYRTFGSIDYSLENGKHISADYDPMKVLVINNSTDELMLEELVYRTKGYQRLNLPEPEGDILYIGPFSSETFSLPHHSIDFLPGDYIPNRIEEYGGGNNSKYWLHRPE